MSETERLATNIVGPEGPIEAKILLVGEAPGEEEDRSGRPFVGSAGRFLDQCLRTVGLVRSSLQLTNVFNQRPPENDVLYFYEDRKKTRLTWEGQEHIQILKDYLEQLLVLRNSNLGGPNLIVALGDTPMRHLTGMTQVSKWRGSILPCSLVPGFKVYITYHPSYVMRLMNEHGENTLSEQEESKLANILPVFLKDLERCLIQSETPTYSPPQRELISVRTLDQARALLTEAERSSLISVDIETFPMAPCPVVRCIGFGLSPSKTFTIPILESRRFFWSLSDEAEIWRMISKVFLSKGKKVFQNGSYDLSILGKTYGLRLADGTFEDTMLLHQASYPSMRKGLDLLASIHTWEPYYKDDGKEWTGSRTTDESLWNYNGKDCAVTLEIYPHLERDAKEMKTWSGYRRTLSVFPSILYMQIRGIKIDLEKKETLAKRFEAFTRESQGAIEALIGREMNLDSPKQISQLLYSELRLPFVYNPNTKAPTTDQTALTQLLYKAKNQEHKTILRELLRHRKYSKLCSTYTSMKIGEDGRVRTSYSWISTYRLSSSESHFGGGGNLQNIPKRGEEGQLIRSLFIPDPEKIFISCDLKQAEAMEVTWQAQDIRLIEAFKSGLDVHWLRAKGMFGLDAKLPYHPDEEILAKLINMKQTMKFFRNIGKTFVHASNYKMGPRKLRLILLREGIDLPEDICRKILHAVQVDSPLTTRWQNEVTEQVRRTRTLITPLGRVREFRGRLTDELFRSAIAFVPQSTVGEIVQLGIQNVYKSCPQFEPLLNVHDEVVGQCLPEDQDLCIKAIDQAMSISHTIHGRELIIPREFKVGPNWGKLHEVIDFIKIMDNEMLRLDQEREKAINKAMWGDGANSIK